MITKIYQSAALLFLVLSCSSLDLVEIENKSKSTKVDVTCPVVKQDVKVYSENSKLNKNYDAFIDRTKFNLIDHYNLWSLTQLASRPDATTLNSKTLTFIKYRGKDHFLITTPKRANSSSYLQSIKSINKFYGGARSLKSYATILDKNNSTVPISKPLQTFIERNKVSLYKNKKLRKYAFKGNQIVREGETVRMPKFSNILKVANRLPKEIFKSSYLFEANQKYSCNFDKKLFTSAPIIQRRTNEIKSNFFGIFINKDNFFLTLTSSLPTLEQFNKELFLVKSLPISSFNAAICISQDRDEMILAKNLVHSEQLLNNLLDSISDNSKPDETLNLKRHINLLYPERTVIEIYGKQGAEINSKTNYFVPTLGKIDIIKRDKVHKLYKEPRTGILKCN